MKNNIEEALQNIHEVRASTSLEKRVENLVFSLPSYKTGLNYPLIAFRVSLAAIILLIVVGLGSGVVVAAEKSRPGNVLFSLKKVIVQTQIHFTSDADKKAVLQKEIEEITPVASPTVRPTIKVKEHEDNEKETEKEVEGISTKSATHSVTVQQEDDNKTGEVKLRINRHEDDDRSSEDN